MPFLNRAVGHFAFPLIPFLVSLGKFFPKKLIPRKLADLLFFNIVMSVET